VNWAKALFADTRGAVLVEYSVLVGVIAITASFALVAVGVAVAENFDFVRGLLLCPIP
jgi:Flp pilus assembly pilin Flp